MGSPKVALIFTLLKCPELLLCFAKCPLVRKLTEQVSHRKFRSNRWFRWWKFKMVGVGKPFLQVLHTNFVLFRKKYSLRKFIVTIVLAQLKSIFSKAEFTHICMSGRFNVLSFFNQNDGFVNISFQDLQTERPLLKSFSFVKYPSTFSPMWGKALKVAAWSIIQLGNSNQTIRNRSFCKNCFFLFGNFL